MLFVEIKMEMMKPLLCINPGSLLYTLDLWFDKSPVKICYKDLEVPLMRVGVDFHVQLHKNIKIL